MINCCCCCGVNGCVVDDNGKEDNGNCGVIVGADVDGGNDFFESLISFIVVDDNSFCFLPICSIFLCCCNVNVDVDGDIDGDGDDDDDIDDGDCDDSRLLLLTVVFCIIMCVLFACFFLVLSLNNLLIDLI